MSKRFGRNQKRAFRNRVAELEKEVDALKKAYGVVARERREYIDEIESAKLIAGEHCVAFRPSRMEVQFSYEDVVNLYRSDPFSLLRSPFHPDYDLTRPTPIRRISLPVMMAITQDDWRERAIHIGVRYQGQGYGYAVAREAFQSERDQNHFINMAGREIAGIIENKLNPGRAEARAKREEREHVTRLSQQFNPAPLNEMGLSFLESMRKF